MKRNYSFSSDEEPSGAVDRYEQFLAGKNSAGYFDVSEYESIVEYYLHKGKGMDCAQAIRMGLKTHPNSSALRIKRAKLYLYSGDAVKAYRILNSITEKDDYDVVLLKIGALLKLNRDSEANKLCEKVLSSFDSEGSEDLFLEISTIYITFERFDAAIKLLKEAEKLHPASIDLLLELAFCYEQVNMYEEAILTHGRIIKIDPYASESWFNLGQIYLLLQEHNDALDAYEYAIAINPDDLLARLQKGHCLVFLKRYEEALSCYYEYAEQKGSYDWQLYNYIAECYEKLDNFDRAIDNYSKALNLAPEENYEILTGLALCLLEQERYEESIPHVCRAIALQPDYPEAWVYLGEAFVGLDETDNALSAYLSAVELEENLPETLFAIGNIYLEKKDFRASSQYYKQAYVADQDLDQINLFLAISLFKQGNLSEALFFLKEAVALSEDALNLFLEICPEATMLLGESESGEDE